MTTLDGYAQTTLAAAQSNNLTAVTAQVADFNTKTTAIYLEAFNNWLINWVAGRVADKSTAPTPPAALVVEYFNDPTTGPGNLGPFSATVAQWAYPALGTTPVCAQPPIPGNNTPAVSMPNHIHVGSLITGSWFTAPSDDTLASGKTTPPVTSDDGVTGVFEKYGAPVGNGWYLLLTKVS